jgi:hypothetical protein
MGISIHYNGSLDDPGKKDEFIEELEAIASELKWSSEKIEGNIDSHNLHCKGVLIGPHKKSEPLAFIIIDDGRLIDLPSLILGRIDDRYSWYNSIKTQYAPIEIHIAVIKLLKYIKKKFISSLEVIDEGDYWQTEDNDILYEKMSFVSSKIDLLGDMLDAQSANLKSIKSADELAGRIEKLLKQFWSKGKQS